MGYSSVYKFVSSKIKQPNPFLVHGLLFLYSLAIAVHVQICKTKSPILHMTEEMGLYFFCNTMTGHRILLLEATNYNKARASKILDIPRTTLWRKIKKYDIMESLG